MSSPLHGLQFWTDKTCSCETPCRARAAIDSAADICCGEHRVRAEPFIPSSAGGGWGAGFRATMQRDLRAARGEFLLSSVIMQTTRSHIYLTSQWSVRIRADKSSSSGIARDI